MFFRLKPVPLKYLKENDAEVVNSRDSHRVIFSYSISKGQYDLSLPFYKLDHSRIHEQIVQRTAEVLNLCLQASVPGELAGLWISLIETVGGINSAAPSHSLQINVY